MIERPTERGSHWNVLIADTDSDVHVMVQLALKDLRFADRGVNILAVHSAAEAREVLKANADIALLLLAAELETADAGLGLVRHIREQLKNANLRIVLRATQSSRVAVEDIVMAYDVNDCRTKSEFTTHKLLLSAVMALRDYGRLQALDAYFEELRHANALLERMVHDCTDELAEANRQLASVEAMDTLTGIANRRHFQEALEREMFRSDRNGAPFCVVLFDIDHLAAVNDAHGYTVGDRVLQAVVDRLGGELRRMDLIGRVGGEEFAALLPSIALTEALIVAERMRAKVAAFPMRVDKADIPVTISLGVVQSAPGQTAPELLSLADDAVYTAKNGGRNRVYGASSMAVGLSC